MDQRIVNDIGNFVRSMMKGLNNTAHDRLIGVSNEHKLIKELNENCLVLVRDESEKDSGEWKLCEPVRNFFTIEGGYVDFNSNTYVVNPCPSEGGSSSYIGIGIHYFSIPTQNFYDGSDAWVINRFKDY